MRQFRNRQFSPRQFAIRQFDKLGVLHRGHDGPKLHPVLLARKGVPLVERVLEVDSPIPEIIKKRGLPSLPLPTDLVLDRDGFMAPRAFVESDERIRRELAKKRELRDLLDIEDLDE